MKTSQHSPFRHLKNLRIEEHGRDSESHLAETSHFKDEENEGQKR